MLEANGISRFFGVTRISKGFSELQRASVLDNRELWTGIKGLPVSAQRQVDRNYIDEDFVHYSIINNKDKYTMQSRTISLYCSLLHKLFFIQKQPTNIPLWLRKFRKKF